MTTVASRQDNNLKPEEQQPQISRTTESKRTLSSGSSFRGEAGAGKHKQSLFAPLSGNSVGYPPMIVIALLLRERRRST